MNKYLLLPFLLLGLLWSCSDSELITPGDEFQNTTDPGTYTFELNGVLMDYSVGTTATSSAEGSQIRGGNGAGQTIVLSIPQALAIGVLSQADGATVIASSAAEAVITNADGNHQLLPPTVNIVAANSSAGLVTGNFSGTVYNPVSQETRVITNGMFFEIHFEPEVQNDRILKANFNDQLFDFSTNAIAQGVQTAAVIQGINIDQIQTLSITVPGGIAVGSFTEADQVVYQVNLGTSGNPNDVYSNYDATTDTYLPVTLNITVITTERVIGSFSGTITKFTNGVPGEEITITDGQINVPIAP